MIFWGWDRVWRGVTGRDYYKGTPANFFGHDLATNNNSELLGGDGCICYIYGGNDFSGVFHIPQHTKCEF